MRRFNLKQLSDASGNFAIHSSCYVCDRKSKTPARDLLAKYGNLALNDLRKRAICLNCRSRNVVLWEMDLLD